MRTAKISVCVLTFNHVDVIESTVRTVLAQTVSDCEIVISDDCSSDGTWERVLQIAAENPRIRAIQTPINRGMAANANFAVSHALGEYIALLHHDDLYRQDLLKKWAEVLDRHEDAAFVFNPYRKYESDHVYEEPMPGECLGGKWLLEQYLFPRWGCVIRGTAMIRKRAWDRANGMREQFGMLADIDLWMRLAMCGPVGYVPEPIITVRHARPTYYPDIYRGETWSWTRLRLLYEIHAVNRLSYFSRWRLQDRAQWFRFRVRLSMETAKWIVYALVRKKPEMLFSCGESATPYDLMPLRAMRVVAVRCARLLLSNK